MKRRFQSILRRAGLQNVIKLWFYSGRPLKEIFKPPKERMNCPEDCDTCRIATTPNLCMKKCLIYEILCNICQSKYLGETKRSIGQRIREHLHSTNFSAVKHHFTQQHPSSNMDITWRIVHSNLNNDFKRRSIESLYIREIPTSRSLNLTLWLYLITISS